MRENGGDSVNLRGGQCWFRGWDARLMSLLPPTPLVLPAAVCSKGRLPQTPNGVLTMETWQFLVKINVLTIPEHPEVPWYVAIYNWAKAQTWILVAGKLMPRVSKWVGPAIYTGGQVSLLPRSPCWLPSKQLTRRPQQSGAEALGYGKISGCKFSH